MFLVPPLRWIALLVAAFLAPPAVAVAVGTGPTETLWSILAVITGTQATVGLALTLAAVARVRRLTSAVGIGGAVGIHRTLGVATTGFALAHLAAVIADNPANVWLLDPTVAPSRAVAGTVALASLAGVVVFAKRRIRRYEWWRWAHRGGATVALVLVVLHILLLNRLLNSPVWAVLFLTVAATIAAVTWWRWFAPTRRTRFLVGDMHAESADVSTVSLRPCGSPLRFDAGQFAWLRLRPGPWAQDHPFTISSSADDDTVEFTFRHAGDWTTGPLRALRPGSPVWVDGPYGAMTLSAADDAAGIVMVAAGVGLTPAMSLLRTLADRGDRRPLILITPEREQLFRDELNQLARRLDLCVLPMLTRPVRADVFVRALPDRAWPAQAAYYVCGPPQMVTDTVSVLADLGIPPGQVHCEQFEMA